MNRRGWVVTLAGMGLNLALGILYAWSVFSKQLVETVEQGRLRLDEDAGDAPLHPRHRLSSRS